MTTPNPAQIIPPSNALRLKAGGGFAGIDASAVAKAEEALKSLSSQFAQWLEDEISKLEAARAAVGAQGYTRATAETLYMRAHDLKGLGSTYEYPIVTRIAGSLCKMTDDEEKRMKAPLFLIDAHIDAIRAAVRDKIKDETHPVGAALAQELEGQVRDHLDSLG